MEFTKALLVGCLILFGSIAFLQTVWVPLVVHPTLTSPDTSAKNRRDAVGFIPIFLILSFGTSGYVGAKIVKQKEMVFAATWSLIVLSLAVLALFEPSLTKDYYLPTFENRLASYIYLAMCLAAPFVGAFNATSAKKKAQKKLKKAAQSNRTISAVGAAGSVVGAAATVAGLVKSQEQGRTDSASPELPEELDLDTPETDIDLDIF